MALSGEDQALVADMEQRELHLKRRQRATDRIQYEVRRYQGTIVAACALAVVIVDAAVIAIMVETVPERPAWWVVGIASLLIAAALGTIAGRYLLQQPWGRRHIARKESELRRKYSGDLHSGRRWLQFTYNGEDISAYIPQILTFLESGQHESVDDALAYAKANRRKRGTLFTERAIAMYDDTVAQVRTLVLSSVDANGTPASRIMRFVTTDRPGVWFVTTAPEGAKVDQIDLGRVAIVTAPTPAGATISSNRLDVRRADRSFAEVASLYEEQVPGYADGMTDEEKEHEIVYELTLHSAKVDTWMEHTVVDFIRDDPA